MKKWKTMSEIRRDYGNLSLSEESVANSPFEQFEQWFKEVLATENSDPTAMVLSTVDKKGRPDSRVVLLKGLLNNCFVFYTNYKSAKATQIGEYPFVALNFYWPQTARQVRVRGQVKKVSKAQSDTYFSSRPLQSQFSAISSPQSQVIKNRGELESLFNQLIAEHQQQSLVRPDYWGGYKVIPEEIEFWQGRDNRLHDRIHYYQHKGIWHHHRLAP
jgi:pyridoxamine 5'-phosphate oxidase